MAWQSSVERKEGHVDLDHRRGVRWCEKGVLVVIWKDQTLRLAVDGQHRRPKDRWCPGQSQDINCSVKDLIDVAAVPTCKTQIEYREKASMNVMSRNDAEPLGQECEIIHSNVVLRRRIDKLVNVDENRVRPKEQDWYTPKADVQSANRSNCIP